MLAGCHSAQAGHDSMILFTDLEALTIRHSASASRSNSSARHQLIVTYYSTSTRRHRFDDPKAQTIGDPLKPRMTHHSSVNLREGSSPTTTPPGHSLRGKRYDGSRLSHAVPTDHLLGSVLSSRFGGGYCSWIESSRRALSGSKPIERSEFMVSRYVSNPRDS